MDYSEVPRICEFFRDREVFMTGGTGTVGKALIEKILYSCPDVGRIFLLVRPKKGLNKNERIAKFTSGMIFNRIREKNTELLKKIVPISGDCMELNLGMCEEDRKLMENVSVIFHGAASIRFDDPLKDAILLNTRGTREVVNFAEIMRSCAHSTTYCNPLLFHVEEKLYPVNVNWRDAIRIAENIDREALDIIAPFYMNFYPNTYTFTKCLCEQVINDYKDRLPVVIFRPSIVTPLDFINGPIAYTLPGSLGINHVGLFNMNTQCDYIPLDIVVKSLIVTAYVHGLRYECHKELPELEVYNCAAGPSKLMSIQDLLTFSKEAVLDWPVDQAIWSSRMFITKSTFLYKLFGIFMQFLPGLILDLFAVLFKKKRRLLPILRTICYATCKLQFFLFHTWNFDNAKCLSLIKHIKDEDHRDFLFNYYPEYSSKKYVYMCARGSRRYLLKQSDEKLQYARRRYRMILIADYISLVIFSILIFYIFLYDYLANMYLMTWK
uniref:Fatty acyl-CoA reductase n=2 Tax=Lutzomyia longipalpis TaxID=7200 RepID=A0A1B0CI27_LUTLO